MLPSSFCAKWLREMSNANSMSLTMCVAPHREAFLEGVDFDVWNNGAFTVHFEW